MDKQQEFNNIITEMSELYIAKNHDYGDAFGQTFAELGIISAITRISDKTNRLKSLATKEQCVDDERIEDTLMDLANYAVMTLIELQDNDDTQPIETVIAYSDAGPVFKTELPTKPIAGVYKGKVYKGRWSLLKDLKHDGFEWFARDYDGDLGVYGNKPEKYEMYWSNDEGSVVIKKDNFPQIKWLDSQPTSISDILEKYLNGGENGN